MSKRKTMDKTQARERRNRLLESAAAAELSLTEGVREMRAISGMTQEEFARHREVSARVIKALELGKGNPTVATLKRIGEFFGLDVGFVPKNSGIKTHHKELPNDLQQVAAVDVVRKIALDAFMRGFSEAFGQGVADIDETALQIKAQTEHLLNAESSDRPVRKKRKTGLS